MTSIGRTGWKQTEVIGTGCIAHEVKYQGWYKYLADGAKCFVELKEDGKWEPLVVSADGWVFRRLDGMSSLPAAQRAAENAAQVWKWA